jgi:hypothetical protein
MDNKGMIKMFACSIKSSHVRYCNPKDACYYVTVPYLVER